MKILFLTNNLKGKDGWSRHSLDLAREIQRKNHQILCLVSSFSEQEEILERVLLSPPLKLLSNPITIWKESRKIKKVIKEFQPEIIHFLAEPYVHTLFFLKPKAKTFLTIHGTFSYMPNLLNNSFKKKIAIFLTKKSYQKLNNIVSVSNFTKNYFLKYLPRLKDKVRVITNGVDLENFKRIDSKKQEDEKEILFVGVVKNRKGILEALRALRYYRENFKDNFKYNIVGSLEDKEFVAEVEKKIKEYGLEKKVFLLGKITEEELKKHYQRADLFLMLSKKAGDFKFEGFGLVYLEASAYGVPCINSGQGGVREAIKEGESGYIVNPLNPKEVAEKISLVLNQKTILSQNCLEWAKENSIDLKADQILKIYE